MKPGAAVIATVCGYEHYAIVTGRFPTITALSARHPHTRRVVALSVFTGWLWVHILKAAVDAKGN